MIQHGIMMASMEPPAELDGEFQDWYDLEHLPSRAAVPGFLNAHRFICVDGWPKYFAAYDLESTDVLKSAPYLAISGANTSPWSHRITSRVYGYSRLVGVQVYPGTAVLGGGGAFSQLLVIRFNATPLAVEGAILSGLKAIFGGRPETVQFRLFRSTLEWPRHLAMVELRKPLSPSELDTRRFEAGEPYLDRINTYVPYFRRDVGPA